MTALIGLFGLGGIAGCGAVAQGGEKVIWRNASFSADGSAVLRLGAAYHSPDLSAPYFSDPKASDWVLRFARSGPTLADPLNYPDLVDSNGGGGGGALFERLFWNSEQELALIKLYDQPELIELATGARHVLRLPPGELAGLFDGTIINDERGLMLDLLPSPDQKTVAVFYRLATGDNADPLRLHFYDALAFFSFEAAPRFLGVLPLSPWAGQEETLRLDPPLPVTTPPLDPGPEGPPVQEARLITAPSYCLWSEDSSRVLVIDRANDASEQNRVAEVLVGTPPSLRLMDPAESIPGAAVPTRGGGVREDGLGLYANEPTDDPNAGGLLTVQIEGWPGFDGRGQTTVAALPYGQ